MRLGFTGHRPQRLKAYSAYLDSRLIDLAVAAIKHHSKGDAVIVSGMALGWDTAAALAAVSLNLPLMAKVPFKGQEKLWSVDQQQTYLELLRYASDINIVSEGAYAVWKMYKRNEAIVDSADMLLALWDGVEKGGTYQCIKYAQSKGKPICNLWSSFIRYV